MGMKKLPTAASVSIRLVAAPMYLCSMSQTRAGIASQAAKPEDEEGPDSDSERPTAPGRYHGDKGQQRGDDNERSDDERPQVPAAVGVAPPSRLPGIPASLIRADSSPPADGSRRRWTVTHPLSNCAAGEVRAVSAEALYCIEDTPVPPRRCAVRRGRTTGATERLAAFRGDGKPGSSAASRATRRTPARTRDMCRAGRAPHVVRGLQGEGGPRRRRRRRRPRRAQA